MECKWMTRRKGRLYCIENPGCQCGVREPNQCGDFKPRGDAL